MQCVCNFSIYFITFDTNINWDSITSDVSDCIIILSILYFDVYQLLLLIGHKSFVWRWKRREKQMPTTFPQINYVPTQFAKDCDPSYNVASHC
jgi:hypothetical protein